MEGGSGMEIQAYPEASTRRRVYDLLESPVDGYGLRAWVQFGLLFLIVFSTAALIAETVPSIGPASPELFDWIEIVTIAIFTIEYVLRLWSCSASAPYSDGLRGRLRYFLSFYALVDLIAILPFYLAMLPVDLRFLRVIRLMRLFRLAKLARYSGALQMLGRVVTAKRYELVVTLFVSAILMTITSAAMYIAEGESQPALFSSIPATMWWAVTTLTTVGYGDMTPVTGLGRLLGTLVAILGIGLFAIPTSILGAAFVDELRSRTPEAPTADAICPTCGQVRHVTSGEK
jgi:voltage-gated potassium channel